MVEAIRTEALTIRRGDKTIVSDVCFSARLGRVTAILGPNGAGKTSLLKALLGLIPSTGRIEVQGSALVDLTAPERARRMAYVPQRTELDASLTVAEVVAQARFAHYSGLALTSGHDKEVVFAALQTIGIEAWAERVFPTLSGGEQRLVLLARALCTDAPVLLLDEPTASLDIGHRLRILEQLRTIARADRAVVCVLHEIEDVRRFADDVAVIHRGACVAHGPVASELDAALIQRVYGVERIEHGGASYRVCGENAR